MEAKNMVVELVFVYSEKVDEFLRSICALGIETDTSFRVDAPSGKVILLRVRGTEDAISRMKDMPGFVTTF